MPDWTKKIRKSVGNDLGGEELLYATIIQPMGSMNRQVGGQLGGLAGAAIASKGKKKKEGAIDGLGEGLAAQIPAGKNLVIGITPTRMLVWNHGAMSGKPKDLALTIPVSDVTSLNIDKGKLSSQAVMRFSDNSAWGFEVARLNNADGFKQAVDSLVAA